MLKSERTKLSVDLLQEGVIKEIFLYEDGYSKYDFLGPKEAKLNVSISYNQRNYKGSLVVKENAENIVFILQKDGTLKRTNRKEQFS